MTYNETLDYLFSQLPMFTRVGASAFKKDLTNTLALCEVLQSPQTKFPTIHVAGTNGKGSTSHMLAAVLQAAGYKTGLYVSPHYRDFRERIKVNGQYIPKRYVQNFVTRYQSDFERIQPSFFEMTVALAFDYFAAEKVDIAIIEVGLGGRLDSTNVISPLLSVITNISFDHMDMLGDTLPQIASEKAGIIKPKTPVVIGETHSETATVFAAKAAEQGAAIYFADQEIEIQTVENQGTYTVFDVIQKGQQQRITAQISGAYQAKNLATVLQALTVLTETTAFKVSAEAVETGLYRLPELTQFIGRWQFLQESPRVLVDSAHNEGGMALAMSQLMGLEATAYHIVLGMVRDKDISKVLALMPPQAHYYFAKANIPRGLEADALQSQAAAFGLKGKAYTSVKRAFAAAKKKAQKTDLIYVGGSIFVVGEVL